MSTSPLTSGDLALEQAGYSWLVLSNGQKMLLPRGCSVTSGGSTGGDCSPEALPAVAYSLGVDAAVVVAATGVAEAGPPVITALGTAGTTAFTWLSNLLNGPAGQEAEAQAAVTPKNGAAIVRMGQAGEDAVRSVFDIGPKVEKVIGGRTRIFDGLNSEAVSEVKNVGYQDGAPPPSVVRIGRWNVQVLAQGRSCHVPLTLAAMLSSF